MEMLEKEDSMTMTKLGINIAIIGLVAASLILISMYFS